MGTTIGRILLVLFVGGTVSLGLYNTAEEWPDAATLLQHVVSAGELVYGVSGLVAAYGLIRDRRWSVWPAVLWGAGVTMVGALAARAYAGDTTLKTIAVAGGASLAIAGVAIWGVHRVTRRIS